MMVYFDSNPVIYLIENRPPWAAQVAARIGMVLAAGDGLAVSDLTRMECLVGPMKSGNSSMLADFRAFFGQPTVHLLALPGPVFDRAARIRATHNFKPLDALHLAAAVEHGCGRFLTNDAKLARFPDIAVEVLA